MVATYLATLRRTSRDGRLYLLTSGLMGFAFWGGIAAVLANLYLLRLGYGSEFIGIYNACGGLGYAAFALPAGALGRRWGSRRTMILGLATASIFGMLVPLAESGPTSLREGWLLISNLCLSAGFSLYSVNGAPFLMAATGPEERNHAFSVSSALGPLSAFVGSLIAGLLPGFFAGLLGVGLTHPAPYRYPLFIAAAMLIPAVLAIFSSHPSGEKRMEQMVGGIGKAPLGVMALLALSVALRTPAESTARTFFNVYLDAGLQEPTSLIGMLTAAGQLMSVPMALMAPLLMAKFGIGRTYALASLGAAASLLPLALVPHWGAAGVGFMGVMGSVSLSFPCMNVFAMLVTPRPWRSTTSSVVALANGVGFIGVALGGGYLIRAAGFPSLFLISSGLAIVATAVFWSSFRTPRGELAPAGV